MFRIVRRCARRNAPATRESAGPGGAACLLLAIVAVSGGTVGSGQENLGFERVAASMPLGWSVAGPPSTAVTVASDDRQAGAGRRSLRIHHAVAAGVTRVQQRVPASAFNSSPGGGAQRLRLSGYVRRAEPAAGSAALWLRIAGERGPLFLDSHGAGQEPGEGAAPAGFDSGEAGAWRRYEIELPFPADADEIAFGVSLRGQGVAWFDELTLDVRSTAAEPAPAPQAARYVEAAVALMHEHSVNRAAVDWATLRAGALAHARGATTAAEAHVAVRFAVRELMDRHSYLQSARAAQALREVAVSNARTGSPVAAAGGRRLAGEFAYLLVPGFAGGTQNHQVEFAESLRNIIQDLDFQEVCGWVVDLRRNTGGNLWPMLAGIGPLLGDGELAASVYPDGRRISVWYRDGQAGFGNYTQLRVRSAYRLRRAVPVAVLTGPATASSAEVLAVGFRGRSATRSFGAPTRGLSAGNRTFALADGAALVLTVAATSDAQGRVVAGPMAPDEAVGEAPGSDDPPLVAALAWLRAADACR